MNKECTCTYLTSYSLFSSVSLCSPLKNNEVSNVSPMCENVLKLITSITCLVHDALQACVHIPVGGARKLYIILHQ